MNRTQIYLPQSQMKKLRELAQKKNWSVSEVIRGVLTEHLEEKPRQDPKKSIHSGMFAVLEEVKASGERGPKDLAKNVDKYLYGS